MAESSSSARRRPRFSVRGLLLLIVLAALALGWFSSQQRADRERRLQQQRLSYAREELRRARDEVRDLMRAPRTKRDRSFWEADLEGSNLAGMTLASKGNAFQSASFRNCLLEDATLIGGDASFQLARFDAANLARARLQGGGGSFQLARFDAAKLVGAHLKGGGGSFQGSSFVGADLTDATLAGGMLAFQGASFEGATLIGAKLSGDFQRSNLNGARCEAADLSTIAPDHLASCYFDQPPSYDAMTRFPPGFDPVEHSWRRVESRPVERE